MIVYEHQRFGDVYYACQERKHAYVFECRPGRPGTLGQQIGDDGYAGNMLSCDGTLEGLRRVVLRWRRMMARDRAGSHD